MSQNIFSSESVTQLFLERGSWGLLCACECVTLCVVSLRQFVSAVWEQAVIFLIKSLQIITIIIIVVQKREERYSGIYAQRRPVIPPSLALILISPIGCWLVLRNTNVIKPTLFWGQLFFCCTLVTFFCGAFPHLLPCCFLPCPSSRCSSAWRPRRRCTNRYRSFSFSARRPSSFGETLVISTVSSPRVKPSRRVEISIVRSRICSSWADRRAARQSAIFKRPPQFKWHLTSGVKPSAGTMDWRCATCACVRSISVAHWCWENNAQWFSPLSSFDWTQKMYWGKVAKNQIRLRDSLQIISNNMQLL